MKARFTDRLISQPWHIGASRGRTIISSMLRAILKNERPEKDTCGDPLPKMQIIGDVAVIPISGVLMLNLPDWVKSYGFNCSDPNDIEEEIDEAINNPAIAVLALAFDSPGGESVAGEKLFDLTEAAGRKKPILSFVGDGAQLCSSAYQAAAPSLAIYAGKYSEVGCIGTYMAYLDDSAYWAEMGLVWETFRSGEFKGIDGKLTDGQREYFQSLVDEYGSRFRNGVSKYRTAIDPADMQGQTFRGIDAAARGFVASNVKDLTAAIAKFRKLL